MPLILTPQALARMRHEGSATRCHFGGDSSSSQTTKNSDQRVVGGDNSQNVSISSGGDTQLTMTDHGAVSASMALAQKGIELAATTSTTAINTNADILTGALKATSTMQDSFTSTLRAVENKDVTVMVIAGLAVVGLAATTMLKKG